MSHFCFQCTGCHIRQIAHFIRFLADHRFSFSLMSSRSLSALLTVDADTPQAAAISFNETIVTSPAFSQSFKYFQYNLIFLHCQSYNIFLSHILLHFPIYSSTLLYNNYMCSCLRLETLPIDIFCASDHFLSIHLM